MSFSSFSFCNMNKVIANQSVSNPNIVIQQFTDANGTWTQYHFLSGTNSIDLPSGAQISILCIGGGGSGALYGGGGGSGGFLEASRILQSSDTITCTIGLGGAGNTANNASTISGGNTTVIFTTNTTYNMTSYGGGGGCSQSVGGNGASGGGCFYYSSTVTGNAIYGTQGNRAGFSPQIGWISASGGGGSGGVGLDSTTGGTQTNTKGGRGGLPKAPSLAGLDTTIYFAGGGSGMCQGQDNSNYGYAGSGCAYNLNSWTPANTTYKSYNNVYATTPDAMPNTGSGGAGNYGRNFESGKPTRGGNGGSGLVIISIKN